MKKDLAIVVLGVWVALVPFLGFPNRWDTVIFVVSGLLIVALMLILRRDLAYRATRLGSRERGGHTDVYMENGDFYGGQEAPQETFRVQETVNAGKEKIDEGREKTGT